MVLTGYSDSDPLDHFVVPIGDSCLWNPNILWNYTPERKGLSRGEGVFEKGRGAVTTPLLSCLSDPCFLPGEGFWKAKCSNKKRPDRSGR